MEHFILYNIDWNLIYGRVPGNETFEFYIGGRNRLKENGMIEIQNLCLTLDKKEILRDINVTLEEETARAKPCL